MTVRHYRQGDETQIQSLFQKSFHQERPLSVWKWKFSDNPKQEKPFILVYEENEYILGHISLWLTDAFIKGEQMKIGLRVDTMVDPEARGKGIYKQLNQALLEEARKEGIEYLYGFPAPKAKELFLRYTGATHLTDMPRWMYVQKPVSLLASKFPPMKILKPFDRLFTKIRGTKFPDQTYEVKEISRCDASFDELADKTRYLESGLVVRDSSYLNWRYFDHPTHQYKIFGLYKDETLQGYVVSNEKSKSFTNGLIVDWLAVDDHVWPSLLNQALQELKNADIIQTWTLPHTKTAACLKAKGFIHKDSPMPLVGKEINTHTADLNDAAKWYMTPGDVDSF